MVYVRVAVSKINTQFNVIPSARNSHEYEENLETVK